MFMIYGIIYFMLIIIDGEENDKECDEGRSFGMARFSHGSLCG